VTKPPNPSRPPDDGVVYLESDGREDLARALAEAEQAVAAAEEKRRQAEAPPAEPALPVLAAPLAEAAAGGTETRFSELAARLADVEERLLTEQEESGRRRVARRRETAGVENQNRRGG